MVKSVFGKWEYYSKKLLKLGVKIGFDFMFSGRWGM